MTGEAPGQRSAGGGRLVALAAGAALVVLLVMVVVMLGRANAARDTALSRERQSHDVMLAAAGMSGSIGHAEAALARFVVLPDNRTFATAYYNEWVAAGRQLERLRRLTAGDPQQAAAVERAAALFTRRGQELAIPAGHANYRKYLPALSTWNEAGKRPTVADLSRALAAVAASERTMLDRRIAESRQAADRADLLARALSGLGLAVVALALALGWSTASALAGQGRAQAEADEESDRAGWLNVAVEERTAALTAAYARLEAEMAGREAAQQQLRQVQKMEAVGQLTGGIAHDFNNMLAVVVGGLEVAQRRLRSEAAEVGRHIDSALDGANRASALTRRLMSFARAEPLLPKAVDPGRLVAGMTDLLDRTLSERIVVTTHALDGLWPVWIDGHQLENAILNLAVNARDAMGGQGRLLIAGANIRLVEGEVGAAAAGDHVCLSVVDDGEGMPAQVVERAMEPFFTTKPPGKGTGLGLSQIFGFVRQSGGDMAIDSVVGRGTVVTLYLPRYRGREVPVPPPASAAEPAPPPAMPALAPRPAVETGPPAILVVEDDPRVLRATMEGLAELGLPAIACGDGEAALARLDATPGIRLLMTDVLMPGLTGPALVRRALAAHPHLGVLFVTGYVGEAGNDGDLNGREVLRKPFTLAALERAVKAALPAA